MADDLGSVIELGRGRNFEQIVDGLPAIVALFTPDGRIAFCNRQMLEYLDETFEEVQAKASAYNFHPDDRDEVLTRWAAALQSGEPFDFEARLRRADGVFRWQRTRVFPLRDAGGGIDLWYGLCTDIDDRKWAETLLAGEKRLLEMVAQGVALAEVLGALCRVVEAAAPGRLCSVLSIDPDGVRFRHGAGPSLPAAYNEVLDGLVMDRYYGPCGMAANEKRQVIAADVATDPRWAASPWPPLVLSHGLRSCWSTPILSRDDKVIGVFALYQDEPATPGEREQELIRQFTQIAGVAIERAQSDASLRRAEQELRRSNAYLAEAQRLSLTGSFTWSPATDEHYWSAETYRIFEYDAATPVSLGLILQSIHPEDLGQVDQVIARAREGRNFEIEFRAVLASGAIKHVQVLAHRMAGQDDRLEYLGAIMDVTERRRAEEALSKVRSELAHMARVTSLGALTASIAHEVNQPLSGIITNANTCLKMLAADPPNVAGAQETARRTVRDGNRAADIIKRLRSLFGKREATSEAVDLERSGAGDHRAVVERPAAQPGDRARGTGRTSAAGRRRSRPAAAGDPEPAAERRRRDERRRRSAKTAGDPDRTAADARPSASPSRTWAWAWTAPSRPSSCSRPSTPPRATAWASASRSAARSSRTMAGGSGPSPTMARASASPSRSPAGPTARRPPPSTARAAISAQ